jgi:hypothetical protein
MPRDIEPEYSDLPIEVLREMSGEERIRLAFELTDRMRRRVWERVCEENPDWPNWQKRVEFMRWFFDPEPLPRGFEEWMRDFHADSPPLF